MNQYIRTVFLWILVMVTVCSCSPVQPSVSNDLEISFRELISIDDINKSFQIHAESIEQRNLKFESDIQVVLENLSNQQIFFPVGYGIRLFIIRDNAWIEIQNKNEYYGEGSLLRPKGEQELGDRISTGVRPILPPQIEDENHQEVLRIVIIGELIKDDDGRIGVPVGAYTDVFINP